MDRLGLPRSNILGYTMPGFATSDVTLKNAWALMRCARQSPAQEIDIRPSCSQMLHDLGHPYSRGRTSLRHYLRECAGRRAHLAPVPAGQLSQRPGARHRRSERAGAGLGNLWRWRSYVALQRQRLRAQDLDPAPDALGHRVTQQFDDARPARSCNRSSIRKSRPNSCRTAATSATSPRKAPRQKIGPYELQDFNLYYITRYGFRPSKVAFLSHHAWGDKNDAATWPQGLPLEKHNRVRSGDDQEVARPVLVSLLQDQSVQALGGAERAEGRIGRLAVATRRLARAQRFRSRGLARRIAAQRAGLALPRRQTGHEHPV